MINFVKGDLVWVVWKESYTELDFVDDIELWKFFRNQDIGADGHRASRVIEIDDVFVTLETTAIFKNNISSVDTRRSIFKYLGNGNEFCSPNAEHRKVNITKIYGKRSAENRRKKE